MHMDDQSYRIYPLGESSLTVEFGSGIDEVVNLRVMNVFRRLMERPFPGFIEAVPSYSSITLHYAPLLIPGHSTRSPFEYVSSQVTTYLGSPETKEQGRLVEIPVCYEDELAPDLPAVSGTTGLTMKEVIALHTASSYHIYMIGFLPGFPYMGTVDNKLHMPRKKAPVPVTAGSVAIAGSQTGIYSLDSPGGWWVIGRTPLKIFDPFEAEPVWLRPGDRIEFHPISRHEFKNHQGRSA
jgi:inhibitor of KinA